jgi:hypothetical protein
VALGWVATQGKDVLQARLPHLFIASGL